MILQYDEMTGETPLGWWLRFDTQKVFVAQTVGDIDEMKRTIEVPNWLAIKQGLESYEA